MAAIITERIKRSTGVSLFCRFGSTLNTNMKSIAARGEQQHQRVERDRPDTRDLDLEAEGPEPARPAVLGILTEEHRAADGVVEIAEQSVQLPPTRPRDTPPAWTGPAHRSRPPPRRRARARDRRPGAPWRRPPCNARAARPAAGAVGENSHAGALPPPRLPSAASRSRAGSTAPGGCRPSSTRTSASSKPCATSAAAISARSSSPAGRKDARRSSTARRRTS
mgnify:CR=1 FL=1